MQIQEVQRKGEKNRGVGEEDKEHRKSECDFI